MARKAKNLQKKNAIRLSVKEKEENHFKSKTEDILAKKYGRKWNHLKFTGLSYQNDLK